MANKTVLALGSFDGVHIGHRVLIEKSIEIAKIKHCKPLVYCFSQTPQNYFGNPTPQILTPEEKESLIESYGATAIVEDFTNDIKKLDPESFINKLVDRFSPRAIVIGYDYRFGYRAAGDGKLLKKLCENKKIDVYIVAAVMLDGAAVSSSKIRERIISGDILEANKMLGYDFFVSGKVKPHKRLGSLIGYPTLNLTNINKIIPKNGVYVSRVRKKNCEESFLSVTSVGTNPTVSNSSEISIETHVFADIGDWYGCEIFVSFLDYIRSVQKFDSIEDLTDAIARDSEVAKAYDCQNTERNI